MNFTLVNKEKIMNTVLIPSWIEGKLRSAVSKGLIVASSLIGGNTSDGFDDDDGVSISKGSIVVSID